jgi:rubrerythrin
MAGIFKVNEVVSIAVEIEKRGEAFYQEMAEKACNDRVKQTLTFLAGEEVKHRKFFAEMLGRLKPLQLPAGSDESEYWAYVNDLIDSHFLFDDQWNQKLISSVSSDQEVLHLATGFEKDSILFFTELKSLVPSGEVKTIEACVQEEKRHLRRLAEVMKATS